MCWYQGTASELLACYDRSESLNDDNKSHQELVTLWEEQNSKGLRQEQLVQLYGSALAAIEKRCLATLNNVTLEVVLDRVINLGVDRYPILSHVISGGAGLNFKGLIQKANQFTNEEIKAGLSYLMVEILTVMGKLTSEVLSESLHKEMMKVTNETALKVQGRSRPQEKSE